MKKRYKNKIPKLVTLWIGVQTNQLLPDFRELVPPTPIIMEKVHKPYVSKINVNRKRYKTKN
jgi:hypothetical protein